MKNMLTFKVLWTLGHFHFSFIIFYWFLWPCHTSMNSLVNNYFQFTIGNAKCFSCQEPNYCSLYLLKNELGQNAILICRDEIYTKLYRTIILIRNLSVPNVINNSKWLLKPQRNRIIKYIDCYQMVSLVSYSPFHLWFQLFGFIPQWELCSRLELILQPLRLYMTLIVCPLKRKETGYLSSLISISSKDPQFTLLEPYAYSYSKILVQEDKVLWLTGMSQVLQYLFRKASTQRQEMEKTKKIADT